MTIYNKLVRDKIPEIIQTGNESCETRVLEQAEFIAELKKKSQEVLQEYLNSPDDQEALLELADLMEVIYALAETHGATRDELEAIRLKKAKARGGFKEKIFLIEVEEAEG